MNDNIEIRKQLDILKLQIAALTQAADDFAFRLRIALRELGPFSVPAPDQDVSEIPEFAARISDDTSADSLNDDTETHFAPFGPEPDDAPWYCIGPYGEIDILETPVSSVEIEPGKDEPTLEPEKKKATSPEAESSKAKQTTASEFFTLGTADIDITTDWVCVTKRGKGRMPTILAEVLAKKSFKFSRQFSSTWVSFLKPAQVNGKAMRDKLRTVKGKTADDIIVQAVE